jgi:hypothetical protein
VRRHQGVRLSEPSVTPTEADPSGENVVMVLREDSAALPSSENRDVVIPPASESIQVEETASLLPAVEAPAPSPAVEVPGPSSSTEVAETSSSRVALTAVTPVFLAPNKTPNKSRVFSKLSS